MDAEGHPHHHPQQETGVWPPGPVPGPTPLPEGVLHPLLLRGEHVAFLNPKMSSLIQKCQPHAGSVHSETFGDSNNAFLPCGDVSGHPEGRAPQGVGLYTSPFNLFLGTAERHSLCLSTLSAVPKKRLKGDVYRPTLWVAPLYGVSIFLLPSL